MYRSALQVPLLAGLAAVLYTYLPLGSKTYCYSSITTLSPDTPENANCFTVARDGTIADVFYSATADAIPGNVIPGLTDGHGHLLQYGELLNSVNLFGAESLEEVRRRIKEYILLHPEAGSEERWIRGVGWDQAAYGRMPTAADLDSDPALTGKYIMLDRIDVHCAWVSPSVLSLLPSPIPSAPAGGEIILDPGPGVFCDNAMPLVLSHWPKPDKAMKTKFVKSAMQALNKVGLVGMHDAGSVPQDLRLFEELAREREGWTVRVYGMLECDVRNTFCPEEAVRIERADGMLSVRSVKLFGDGALGSWGSALLTPYTDRPTSTGSLLVNASTLTSLATSWASLDYQVNIHAIGDLANRNAISALSAALSHTCPSNSSINSAPTAADLHTCQTTTSRHRIEHSQIMHPTDQARLHALGLIPSIQPTHATSDMSYALSRLGKERLATSAYRMRSFLPLTPILGSDFPVEPPNPWHGMYAAVARRNPATGMGVDEQGTRGNVSWYGEEALTVSEALQGFTSGPARGAFREGRAGVLGKGSWADWVVLDEKEGMESWKRDVERLRGVQVRETWVAGRRVYDRESEEEEGVREMPGMPHEH